MGICVSCRRRDLQALEKRAGGGRVPAKGAAAELLPQRVDPAMANSISNIKLTYPIKAAVSRRRKRYIKDGFNLDLAYITDRLIAMGFPAEKLESVYRNPIDEVFRFLEEKHKDHYKIYNLCSERCYEPSKFHGRVARYAFEDHTPPNMGIIQPFCEDVHKWLSEDPRNVAAVHCKAGKGRTGTMVCCYLLYSGQKATANEALQFYGTARTHDEKGVTIPSQRRYVEYYAHLLGSGLVYSPVKLHIRELVMSPPPALNGGQCTLELTVTQLQPSLKTPSGCHEVRKHDSHIRMVLEQCTPLQGDVRVDVYNKPKMMKRKEKLFHFWFNTFFVANGVGAGRVQPPPDSVNLETFKLTLSKWQLDDAHKDKLHKIYSSDFKVELILQRLPPSSVFVAAGRASPPSSSASDTTDPEPDDEHWDSGEPCRPRAQPRRQRSHDPSKHAREPGGYSREPGGYSREPGGYSREPGAAQWSAKFASRDEVDAVGWGSVEPWRPRSKPIRQRSHEPGKYSRDWSAKSTVRSRDEGSEIGGSKSAAFSRELEASDHKHSRGPTESGQWGTKSTVSRDGAVKNGEPGGQSDNHSSDTGGTANPHMQWDSEPSDTDNYYKNSREPESLVKPGSAHDGKDSRDPDLIANEPVENIYYDPHSKCVSVVGISKPGRLCSETCRHRATESLDESDCSPEPRIAGEYSAYTKQGYMRMDSDYSDKSEVYSPCVQETRSKGNDSPRCMQIDEYGQISPRTECPHGCVNEVTDIGQKDSRPDELCPHGYRIVTKFAKQRSDGHHKCMRLEKIRSDCTERLDMERTPEQCLNSVDPRYAYENADVEIASSCNNCIQMDFSHIHKPKSKKHESDKAKQQNASPIKTMENAGMLSKDGYMLMDRTPRIQKMTRVSDPCHVKRVEATEKARLSDPTGRKCRHGGMLTRDGYMLVDASPRPPRAPHSTDGVTNTRLNSETLAEEFMEFSATDGYMKPVDKVTNYTDEYAFVCDGKPHEKAALSEAKGGIAEASEKDDDVSEFCFSETQISDPKSGKNKKHSFFKWDDYKNEKGKIPKVSTDHTFSDESKKKYNLFQRREEDGPKPKFDMRASWREFSGIFTDGKKKKERDDS